MGGTFKIISKYFSQILVDNFCSVQLTLIIMRPCMQINHPIKIIESMCVTSFKKIRTNLGYVALLIEQSYLLHGKWNIN